jgi:hypothetical protein
MMELPGTSSAICPYGRIMRTYSYGRLAKSNSHLYVVLATNCDFNIIAELTGDNRISTHCGSQQQTSRPRDYWTIIVTGMAPIRCEIMIYLTVEQASSMTDLRKRVLAEKKTREGGCENEC